MVYTVGYLIILCAGNTVDLWLAAPAVSTVLVANQGNVKLPTAVSSNVAYITCVPSTELHSASGVVSTSSAINRKRSVTTGADRIVVWDRAGNGYDVDASPVFQQRLESAICHSDKQRFLYCFYVRIKWGMTIKKQVAVYKLGKN